jgi:hypothetical protein
LLLALFMAASMWLYVQRVMIPQQKNQDAMRQRPRGNLSDLYPRWLGARELLLHDRDPYRADITREIQIGYYGRPLDPTRPSDSKDEQRFAYPIYVVLLLAPTVTLPFATVRQICFWLFVVFTAATVPLWLRTLGWRVSCTAMVVWILLTVSCFPAIQGLKLQQLTILVATLVAGSMNALVRRQFVLAGMLLAFATIKPQLVFLLVVSLCIWVLGSWRERQHLFWSFAISMTVLIIAGEFLLPGWIGEFRAALKDYYRYTGGGKSVLDIMVPPLWGRITSALVISVLLVFCWRNRRANQDTAAFQWSLCFTLATTLLVIPMFAPYNQLLLLPGIMIVVRSARDLWQKSRSSRFLCSITACSIAWQFVAAACLVIALIFLPDATVQKAWGVPVYASFAIPITIYALLLICRGILADQDQAATK